MFRVGAISDTHVRCLDELPQNALKILSKVDLIIHAGDYTHPPLIEELRAMGEFKGVFGNMDPPEVRKALPSVLEFEVMGIVIGVTHPFEGGPPFNIEKRVKDKFRKPKVIIYGHTHLARKSTVGDVLLINPGSTTGTFPAINETMCVLELGNIIKAEVIKI